MFIAPMAWYKNGYRHIREKELLKEDPGLHPETLGFLKVGDYYDTYCESWEICQCASLSPLLFTKCGDLTRYPSTEFAEIHTTSGLYAIKGDLPEN